MQILNFMMPPFARIQWASGEIKKKYEPLFNKAKSFYYKMELETVKHELRKVTTAHYYPEELDIAQRNLAKYGLFFLPIQKVGLYNGFSNYHPPVIEGQPWRYYGVIASNTEDAEDFAHGSEIVDHTALGKLLGYPDCCIEMLNTKWTEGYKDPIWQQSENMDEQYIRFKKVDEIELYNGKKNKIHTIRLKDIPWESNTFLRPFSVGPIFHVKCSMNCQHTFKIAKSWFELGNKIQVDGMKEVEMFLRMPMEWDALKGIAYIRTPLFKGAINSVMCVDNFKVQLEGTYFPDDAPKSFEYPWTEQFVTVARNGNKLIY